jgi:hypothetical protein
MDRAHILGVVSGDADQLRTDQTCSTAVLKGGVSTAESQEQAAGALSLGVIQDWAIVADSAFDALPVLCWYRASRSGSVL